MTRVGPQFVAHGCHTFSQRRGCMMRQVQLPARGPLLPPTSKTRRPTRPDDHHRAGHGGLTGSQAIMGAGEAAMLRCAGRRAGDRGADGATPAE